MQLPIQVSERLPTLLPTLCKYHLKIMPKKAKLQLINMLMNRLFKQSIHDKELNFLQDKYFQINVVDLDYILTITFKDQKLVIVDNEIKSDVILKSTFNPLILLILRKEDPDTLFFNRILAIEGNTALVLEIKNWLDSLDFDLIPKTIKTVLFKYSEVVESVKKNDE